MKKFTRRSLWVLVLGLVLIQFIPVTRSNPPVTGEVAAPANVLEALRSSCYDCHSNDTLWPWYSRVAPVSWLITKHVREGRENLNFSQWEDLSPEDQEEARGNIWEEIERGAMPLSEYLRMHPQAVLTSVQMDAIQRWSEGQAPEFPDWN
jgi:hypothetical protein